MAKKKIEDNSILQAIIKGIEDKKGYDIVHLDLSKLHNAVCNTFVVCSGNSSTQVDAIADSVLEEVWKTHREKPWHKEGFENKEWILLDFVDTVVHIFQPEVREFYGIEELWADAQVKKYDAEATR